MPLFANALPAAGNLVATGNSQCPGRWPKRIAAFVAVLGIGAVVANRALVGRVFTELRAVEFSAFSLVVGLTLAQRLLSAATHRAATPGVSLSNAVIASEAYAGASQSMAGGAGLGAALRIAMYRSWGIDGLGITTSIVASTAFPSLAMWVVGGAYTVPLVLNGSADRNECLVAAGSLVFVGGSLVFWTLLLRHASATPILRRVLVSAQNFSARFRSKKIRDTGERAVELASEGFDDARVRARKLIRANGPFMLLASVGSQLTLAMLFVASAGAVAPGESLGVLALIKTFALLRVMSSFVPVPGGVGIVDVGMMSALSSGGLRSSQAFAAIALYRFLTFLLPLFTGPACALLWWRREGSDARRS